MKKPIIVPIPVKMEKFLGTKGNILHPEIEMVKDLIRLIPLGKIATIDTLAKKMAQDFGADVSCPMRTGSAVKKIINQFSSNNSESLPYWRVVKKNKELINSNSYEICALKLEDEGFKLSYLKSNKIKVNFDNVDLFLF